jgi:hypothetical protein
LTYRTFYGLIKLDFRKIKIKLISRASHPQLHLMTKLLNIEGVTVKNYQIIENIEITIYLDNNNKKAISTVGRKLINSIKIIIM